MPARALSTTHTPHAGTPDYPGGQVAVIQACLDYQTVVCAFGRAFGKTAITPFLFLEEGALIPEPYEFGYFAPTQKACREPYRRWKLALAPMLDSSRGLRDGHNDTEMILHVRPWGDNLGASLRCWGLDEYDNVRGPRLHRGIVDEVKDVHPVAIRDVVIPMLLGREGGGLLLQGTPKRSGLGARYFREMFRAGRHPDATTITSLTAPSYGNPHLSPQQIRDLETEARRVGGEEGVREEIYAEFIEDSGQVFPNLDRVFSIPILRTEGPHLWIGEDPDRGTERRHADRYLIGFDVGFENAASAALVFNRRTRQQAALLRMPKIDQVEQRTRLEALRQRYNSASVVYDDTGGWGRAVCGDAARYEHSPYVGRTWTQAEKESDIAAARFLCERSQAPDQDVVGRGWQMMDVPIQRVEWESYQAVTETTDGRPLHAPRYGPPPGMTADTVSAGCLVAGRLQTIYHDDPKPDRVRPYTVEWFEDGRTERATYGGRKLGPSGTHSPLRRFRR